MEKASRRETKDCRIRSSGGDRVGLASRWQKRENKSASLSGNEWNGVTDCSSAVEEGGTGHGLWALARTTWWTEGLFPGMRGPADRQAGRMVPPLAVEAARAKQTVLPRGSPRRGGKCQARGSAGSGEAIAKTGDCSKRSSDEGHGPNERRRMVRIRRGRKPPAGQGPRREAVEPGTLISSRHITALLLKNVP